MNRKIVFSEGEFYHLYGRGVEKRKIFLDANDYKRFISLLYYCNNSDTVVIRDVIKKDSLLDSYILDRDTIINIGAYCLMSNHFHILVKEKTDKGISKFMQKLLTAYTMYFNKKYERVGPLFCGKFQAQHADSDEYLKYLYSYIHLNPLKIFQSSWKDIGINNTKKAESFLCNYKYSSYIDYIGTKRGENNILDNKVFPEYFESCDFYKTVEDAMEYYNTYHPIPRLDLGK
jgi:putative transposase